MNIDEIAPDAIELAKALMRTALEDPDDKSGRLSRLLASLREDLMRELPEDREELLDELEVRAARVQIVVGVMLQTVVVGVLRVAEGRGLPINRDILASAYDVAVDLEAEG